MSHTLGQVGMRRALRRDAQGFDEIRIVTDTRYKESEYSGDEWRISAVIEFYRKGRVVHRASGGRNVEAAIMMLGYRYAEALGSGKGFFAGEGTICDQEGCTNTETEMYRLKKGFNNDGNERLLPKEGEYRRFCKTHAHRGDASMEDCDSNYELVNHKG